MGTVFGMWGNWARGLWLLGLTPGCFNPTVGEDIETQTGSAGTAQATSAASTSAGDRGASTDGGPTTGVDSTGSTAMTTPGTDGSDSSGGQPQCGDGEVVATELCLVEGDNVPLGSSATLGQLAVADLDADTHLDIVAAFGGPDILVFLGDGDGTFAAAPPVPVAGAYSVAVAAINGGSPDLVAVDVFASAVARVTGLGNGTFSAPSFTSTGTGSGPWGLTAADIDNDTDIDVLVAITGTTQVGVLRNNGSGGFLGVDRYDVAAGSAPQFVEVGLLDDDSVPDAVVGYADAFSVMLGTGVDGALALDNSIATTFAFEHRLADLNGDSELDLLYALNDSQAVGVRTGNGDGTFSGESTFATGNTPQALVIADVDQDTNLDIVVGNTGSSTVSVLRGDGTASFGAQEPYDTSAGPGSVAAADFNEDGAMDIAWMGGGPSDSVLGVFLSDP